MKDEAIYRRLFRTALLIRLVEERIIELYPSDKIQSPVHLSIGQEAVAVGVCDGLQMVAFYDTAGPAAPESPGYLGFATIPGNVCAAQSAPAAGATPQ